MSTSANELENEFIKIYMLTKLTVEEENAFVDIISQTQEDIDNDQLKPHLVPWELDEDGTV